MMLRGRTWLLGCLQLPLARARWRRRCSRHLHGAVRGAHRLPPLRRQRAAAQAPLEFEHRRCEVRRLRSLLGLQDDQVFVTRRTQDICDCCICVMACSASLVRW